MRDLPAATTWPSASRAGAVDMSRSRGVVGRPRGRREVLEQGERRRELEHRVAVVVGVGRRGDRAVAGADPDVAGGVDDRGRAAHPDGALALAGRRVDVELGRGAAGLGHGDHPAVVRRAVAVVAAVAEDDPSAVERQARALQQRGGSRAGRVDVLGQLGLPGRRVEPDQLVRRAARGRPRRRRRRPPTRVSSITGVPVMPTVGEMSPQGSEPGGTGVPRWVDHSTAPVVAGEGVDGVVLGGHEDAPVRDERLAVELAVEGG